jgi:hypothetical protein
LLRLPERPLRRERAPGGLERADELALARGDAAAHGAALAGERDLREQPLADGDVVQLASVSWSEARRAMKGSTA